MVQVPAMPAAIADTTYAHTATTNLIAKVPLALNWTVMGEKLDALGPYCGYPKFWMRKIKKALDPNVAADPSGYVAPEQ